ncbi:DUF5994 family protein [Amycolatopsis vastitatis]|uniref:DUF5994 family protein n=1 Tax=Amycolatopsis vastitatis TaxID=1905142 RepID=UPI0011776D59|nr:DUF5994 family protein [Amycolatopsis vastitatis]
MAEPAQSSAPIRPTTGHVDGHVVRLEGFRSQGSGTLTVIGWDRHRLTMLVIPPETSRDAAQHVLATAADKDNTDAGARLFAAAGTTEGGVPLPA